MDKIFIAFVDFLLTVVTVGIVLLALVLAKYAESNKLSEANTISKAEFIIEMEWEPGSKNDVDLFVMNPNQETVFYKQADIGMMTLDRDDRGEDYAERDDHGIIRDNTRREVISIRGFIPGTYTVNARMFSNGDGKESNAKVTIRKLNPYKEVATKTVSLLSRGDEKTIASFDIDANGDVLSVDQETEVSIFSRLVL